MRKIFILMILLFISIISVNAYYLGYIEVKEDCFNITKSFNINKIDNYTYYLKFIHYGNINSSMEVDIYLNGRLVYKIDDSNDGSGNYKKNVSIDITNYLKDGKNVLRVVGINLMGNELYHPYYVLNNVYINEPTKTPIKFEIAILTLILMTTIVRCYIREN